VPAEAEKDPELQVAQAMEAATKFKAFGDSGLKHQHLTIIRVRYIVSFTIAYWIPF
jgi:hypothetical protein